MPARRGTEKPSSATSTPSRSVKAKARRPAATAQRRKRRPRAKLTRAEIAEVFRRFKQSRPDPKGELECVNVFTLLIAVVLSAQATDAGVNRATRALFKVADTPERMLALGEAGLIEHIKSIGLFRSKAKNVMGLCQQLIAQHAGEVPRDRAQLEHLPGVGRKTANVVLNVAFGEPTMAVDTHVFRVANRIGLVTAKDPLETERQLLACIPPEYGVPAHHWLILHGRYLCKARKPECWRCPIASICKHPDKTPPPS